MRVAILYKLMFCVILITSSCAVSSQFNTNRIQKRRYNKGWHINSRSSNQTSQKQKQEKPVKKIERSADLEEIEFIERKISSLDQIEYSDNDTISIGTELDGVVEIGDSKESNESLVNGIGEVQDEFPNNESTKKPRNKVEPYSIVAFCLVILTLGMMVAFPVVAYFGPAYAPALFAGCVLVFSILSMIFGVKGTRRVESGRYKRGKFFGVFGFWFGLLFTIVTTVIGLVLIAETLQ